MKKLLTLLLTFLCLFCLVGCSSSDDEKTISIACTPTPHAEILTKAAEILAKDGWKLKIVEYEDYVQPMNVVEDGEIDANYFAHVPYIIDFNAKNNTNQVVVAKVHYEPFGIYPGKKNSLDQLTDGDDIIIPNDGSNETRALLLLQDNGIITLPDGVSADSTVTKKDVKSYNVNINIVEQDAAQIARSKDDAAMVVLNGNFALAAGLNVAKDSITFEKADSSAAKTYVNVLAVKAGNENKEGILALKEVLESKEIAKFITGKYEGAVIPFN